MMIRSMLTAALLSIAVPALAQTQPPSRPVPPTATQTPVPAQPNPTMRPVAPNDRVGGPDIVQIVPPAEQLVLVRLTTSAGIITIGVDTARAPVTASNFLRYVDLRRMDGITFYRAMRMADGGLIQGGLRGDRARIVGPIRHEPTTTTGLSHTNMAISMARGAPGSADGDFFIIVGTQMTGLDANPAASGDNQGFAVFGRVVGGEDVVRAILIAPTSPTEGVGAMRGQMLSPTVRIITARRVVPVVLPAAPPAPGRRPARPRGQ